MDTRDTEGVKPGTGIPGPAESEEHDNPSVMQYCTPTIPQEDQGQYFLGQLWASVAKCLRLLLSAQTSGAKYCSAFKSLFASQVPWCIILHSPVEH